MTANADSELMAMGRKLCSEEKMAWFGSRVIMKPKTERKKFLIHLLLSTATATATVDSLTTANPPLFRFVRIARQKPTILDAKKPFF
jgi:hypothetical protein